MHALQAAVKALLLLICMLLSAVIQPRALAVNATEDVANISPCELESIINQLVNPSPEYQLHVSALRNQLKNILRERQLAVGEEQPVDYSDYTEEDKRSVAALAAQGLLHPGTKRSLATLAKNGQLPTPDPEDYSDESGEPSEQKRYIGAVARTGGLMTFGKRNVGTLARDYQLPNGKRNLATMARLGMLGTTTGNPKRNVAAVARYNSQNRAGAAASEKRNLGALKGSPVHGAQQKREEEEVILPAISPRSYDYVDYAWLYPSYADLDWGDFGRAQKRFLDTSKDAEIFAIEHAAANQAESNSIPSPQEHQQQQDTALSNIENIVEDGGTTELMPEQSKRHIGAVYRSGFLPTYRYLRSTTGSDLGYGGNGIGGGGSGTGGGSRFSRSGRARQFVEFYPPHERLRQPIAAVCKRCFLPNRPLLMNWNGGISAGTRGRLPKYFNMAPDMDLQQQQQQQHQQDAPLHNIATNSLPTNLRNRPVSKTTFNAWGTPPRITALHRRDFRRNGPMENFEY